MQPTEFFFFLLPLEPGKRKRRITRYKMTLEEAAKRYPGAEPDLGSREFRGEVESADQRGHGAEFGNGMPRKDCKPSI